MSIIKQVRRGALGLAVAMTALVAHADDIYSFTAVDPVNAVAFGSGPFGTVTLHQSGANMDFKIVLRSDLNFVNTGGPHSVFSFNASGVAAGDVSNIKFNGVALPGFTVVSPGENSPFGSNFSLAIDCTVNVSCANGAPGQSSDPLTFTVANATYTDFGFLAANTTAYFASDVICGAGACNGVTGAVGVVNPPTVRPPQEIPEPGSLALLGLGLAAAGFARRIARR